MNKVSLAKSRAVIVIHEATTGLAYDLRDYLLKVGFKELLFIAHPLLYLKENFKNSSHYALYRNSKLVKSNTAFHWVLPEPLLYTKDFFYTILWCMTGGSKYDLFFGVGNLNAFSGYVLRLLGRVDKVIYYVIDYVPKRFNNTLLNWFYHRVEKFCAQHCDWTWNLSPRMIEGRSKRWHMYFPNQLVVRHGVNVSRIKKVSFKDLNKRELLYMGTILKKQGIQLIISSLPYILKRIPDVTFTIIGKGPYEVELKKLVRKLDLEKHVKFLGYIPDHRRMEDRIAKAAIAIALYNRRHDDFTYFADPGKIKNYLGAAVPVIMTDVPYVAREVAAAKCGFIVHYQKNELKETILRFLSNERLMHEYRKNALYFARKFDWDRIFFQALRPVLKQYNSNN